MNIGRAGEHLVCADLIASGFKAYLVDGLLPYDVVVDVGGKLLRIQVKTTKKARTHAKRKSFHYRFRLNKSLDGVRYQRYDGSEFDLIALVALDIKTVAYLPSSKARKAIISLHPPSSVNHGRAVHKNIDQYPFSEVAA